VFNFDKHLKPLTQVQTSQGSLYLYPLRNKDYDVFKSLRKEDSLTRIREFLPRIASFTATDEIKSYSTRLSPEDLSCLTDQEIEDAAESYAKKLLDLEHNGDSSELLDREEGEHATSYLDRLLEHKYNEHLMRIKLITQRHKDSLDSLFDAVKASTMRLGSTINEFEKLKIKQPTVIGLAPSSVNSNAIYEKLHNQSLDRSMERIEVSEYIRVIGQMTEDSAKSLKSLVELSTTFLETMAERKRESDKSTRIQVFIAILAVATSAILSLFSFFQDKASYKSGDRWQQELLNTLRQNNQVRVRNQEEIHVLKRNLVELQAQLKAVQGSGSRANYND
jgi:hypothetical protein